MVETVCENRPCGFFFVPLNRRCSRKCDAPARGGAPLRYSVGLLYTNLPSGGVRWWWSCPACRARVDAMYLPADRDRQILGKRQLEPVGRNASSV
jgi:hypothetical protein